MNKLTDMITAVRDYFLVPGQWITGIQHNVQNGVVQYCIAGAANAYAQGNLGEADGFSYSGGIQGYKDLAKALGFGDDGEAAIKMVAWNNDSTREQVVARLTRVLEGQPA